MYFLSFQPKNQTSGFYFYVAGSEVFSVEFSGPHYLLLFFSPQEKKNRQSKELLQTLFQVGVACEPFCRLSFWTVAVGKKVLFLCRGGFFLHYHGWPLNRIGVQLETEVNLRNRTFMAGLFI